MKTRLLPLLLSLLSVVEAKEKTWCIEGCNITAKIEPDLCVSNCKWDHPRRPLKTVLDIFQEGLEARFAVREFTNHSAIRHWFSVQDWGGASPLKIYRQVIDRNTSEVCAMSGVTASKVKSAAQTVIDQVRYERHREKARRIGWIIPVSFVGFLGLCLLCAMMGMPP